MSERFVPIDTSVMPCLFCGNTEAQEMCYVKRDLPNNDWNLTTFFRVGCSCGACGPEGFTKEEAVKLWDNGFEKWVDKANGY